MVDFSRYRGILVVGASLFTALAILDGLLFATAGRSPLWLSTDQHPDEWEDLDAAGSKVAGMVAQFAKPQTGDTEQRRESSRRSPVPKLGLLLGRSTSREDVDPSVLEADGCGGVRWLSLYGAGGSLTYLEDFDQLFAFAKVRPELVVFAINPHMLVGRPAAAMPGLSNPKQIASNLWERNWGQAVQGAENLLESKSWILSFRPFLNQHFRRTVYQTRLQLFAACDLGIPCLFRADPDPWKVQLLGYPLHKSREFLDDYWQKATRFGWFDPQRYQSSSPQAISLARQIGNWKSRGSQVFIVLLPEMTRWREQIPRKWKTGLLTALSENLGENVPPVIDLRDTMSDKMFTDYMHLNEPGRRAFSVLLAKRFRNLLSQESAD